MIKEIKYNGLSNTPSDYDNPDGDLAAAINIIPEDGELCPVHPPQVLFKLPQDQKVLFIHKTVLFTHYIILDKSNVLYWKNGLNEYLQVIKSFGESSINQINAVGNTLMILLTNGVYYSLWKDNNYVDLGIKMPEVIISFGLQGKMERTDEFEISFDKIDRDSIYKELSDNNKGLVTNQILAKVNKFVQDYSIRNKNGGRFLFPFFVRYAYRLYDGSLTMHSSPILMLPSTNRAPICFITHLFGDGGYTNANIRICGLCCDLDYGLGNLREELSDLKNWHDIVKSVDIFISAPIYTYDQSGYINHFSNVTDISDSYAIALHTNKITPAEDANYYQKRHFGELYWRTFNYNDFPKEINYPGCIIELPQFDKETIGDNIRNCSTFYFLKSLNLDEIINLESRSKINISKDYLSSLVNKEKMTDDYDSHDLLISKYSFAYNSRINLTGIRKKLFNGFNIASVFPYSNGKIIFSSGTFFDNTGRPEVSRMYYVWVFIQDNNKEIVVKIDKCLISFTNDGCYFYYPNPNAYRAVIEHVYGVDTFFYYDIKLKKHDYLNGAYYFSGFNDFDSQSSKPSGLEISLDKYVELPNKIYTSEINNPFYFPVKGINTVGTGEIMGICSAVKALSQGQFGQFPLYAFTTEGVWALEVSSEGMYTARQPVTRDICTNPESITQIDSAVLFATERGIMLIAGSESKCITDILDGNVFRFDSLPSYSKLLEKINLPSGCFDYIKFKDYISRCKMTYDYKNQRIIVFNPIKTYAYIYSMKSKQWGMIKSNFTDAINSYPNAYIITSDNCLVNLSNPLLTEKVRVMFLTRPIRLDMQDVLKTIDSSIHRGMFYKNHVSQVLYGSRDLYNWFVINSSVDQYLRGSRGTPFKYFRYAIIAILQEGESISGCSISFTSRQTNQLR